MEAQPELYIKNQVDFALCIAFKGIPKLLNQP